ncbi:ABC transporter ATP-binding protein [Paracoccaceae bacterium]|nr:ABC transporter ATP-binding protein [Paracoccaceae bacterium]
MTLLHVEGLQAGYGSAKVLFDVGFSIKAGEAASLMGRNGMGKSTTIKAIMGLLKPDAGKVVFKGVDLTAAPPYRVAQAGIGLVPEGRQIFPTLTVEENLRAIAISRGKWTLELVYNFFPRLAERSGHLGSQLSGGEQQMLAIGRALMTNPSLLILDEATEGLAPLIGAEIWAKLAELKTEGEAILVIDKNIDALSKLVDHHTILEKGRVVCAGSAADLQGDPDVIDRYLHL